MPDDPPKPAGLKGISDDVNAVIIWELSHGNSGDSRATDSLTLEEIVTLARPLTIPQVPPTLQEWSWEDPHYGQEDWRRGYKSTISGQVVCGPIRK